MSRESAFFLVPEGLVAAISLGCRRTPSPLDLREGRNLRVQSTFRVIYTMLIGTRAHSQLPDRSANSMEEFPASCLVQL